MFSPAPHLVQRRRRWWRQVLAFQVGFGLLLGFEGCLTPFGFRTDEASQARAQRQVLIHGRISFLCAVSRPAPNLTVQLMVGDRPLAETQSAADGQFALSAAEPLSTPALTSTAPLSLTVRGKKTTLERTSDNNYVQVLALPCPDR